MDTKLLARIGAIAFVAIAITISVIGLRTTPKAVNEPTATTTVEAEPDPIHAALIRCQGLGEAGASDPACLQTWAENRRRFLSPGARPEERLPELPDAEANAAEPTPVIDDQPRPPAEPMER